jgi:hypothetical protein
MTCALNASICRQRSQLSNSCSLNCNAVPLQKEIVSITGLLAWIPQKLPSVMPLFSTGLEDK